MTHHYYVYLQFDDSDILGRIRYSSFEDACETFDGYEDEHRRKREGVKSRWVIQDGRSEPSRGSAPKNWSPDDPVHETRPVAENECDSLSNKVENGAFTAVQDGRPKQDGKQIE